jgi:hypothetical protein
MERIINPKTKKYITIGGPTYNTLLEKGYEASYLNSLKTKYDLALSNRTTEPVKYNNDVMKQIIMYMNIANIYALYNTSKYFIRLINQPEVLKYLGDKYGYENFTSFNQLIEGIIHDNTPYITSAFLNNYNIIATNKNKITICKSRRDKSMLCYAKYQLHKYGFGKELDILYYSKTDAMYKKNLYGLYYALLYELLSLEENLKSYWDYKRHM